MSCVAEVTWNGSPAPRGFLSTTVSRWLLPDKFQYGFSQDQYLHHMTLSFFFTGTQKAYNCNSSFLGWGWYLLLTLRFLCTCLVRGRTERPCRLEMPVNKMKCLEIKGCRSSRWSSRGLHGGNLSISPFITFQKWQAVGDRGTLTL